MTSNMTKRNKKLMKNFIYLLLSLWKSMRTNKKSRRVTLSMTNMSEYTKSTHKRKLTMEDSKPLAALEEAKKKFYMKSLYSYLQVIPKSRMKFKMLNFTIDQRRSGW